MDSLEEKVQGFIDIEEIKQLKAMYCWCSRVRLFATQFSQGAIKRAYELINVFTLKY